MKEKKFLTVKDMVLIAVFTALIAVCSLIQIPVGAIPFTLQTFAIFTTAGLLGTKRGIISLIAYILLGTIGVPVFAGGKGGPAIIAGPTGGYITGFVFTIIIISVLMKFAKSDKSYINLIITMIAMILGDLACMTIGTIQFATVMKTSIAAALSYCVVPFVITDLVKMALSVLVINRMRKYIKMFD